MERIKRIVDCGKTDNFHIERTQAVELFFKDARRYPVLSADEERKLLIAAKTGTPEEAEKAKKRLVECNQLFVASVAKKFNTNGNFLDIVNEGNIGLLMAIDAFDLKTKHRFISYAVHWVKKRINDYNVKYSCMVNPKNANLIYTYARKARNAFFLKNERWPTLEELKEEILAINGVAVPDKNDLMQFTVNTIANERERDELDNRYGVNGNFMTKYDSETSSNNVEADSDIQDDCDVVNDMLSNLNEEKREIIKGLYGIDTDIEETPNTIALRMGISVNKVKRMAKEAIVEMRAKSRKMAI